MQVLTQSTFNFIIEIEAIMDLFPIVRYNTFVDFKEGVLPHEQCVMQAVLNVLSFWNCQEFPHSALVRNPVSCSHVCTCQPILHCFVMYD